MTGFEMELSKVELVVKCMWDRTTVKMSLEESDVTGLETDMNYDMEWNDKELETGKVYMGQNYEE